MTYASPLPKSRHTSESTTTEQGQVDEVGGSRGGSASDDTSTNKWNSARLLKSLGAFNEKKKNNSDKNAKLVCKIRATFFINKTFVGMIWDRIGLFFADAATFEAPFDLIYSSRNHSMGSTSPT